MAPSLKVGQRVQYTEDGILSMIYGRVTRWQFNPSSDRVEYRVHWERENCEDEQSYPKNRLYRRLRAGSMTPFVRLEDDFLDLLAHPVYQKLVAGNESRLDPVRTAAADDFAQEFLSHGAWALFSLAASCIVPVGLEPYAEETADAHGEFVLDIPTHTTASVTLTSHYELIWSCDYQCLPANGTAHAKTLGECVAFFASFLDVLARRNRNEAIAQC